MAYYQHPLDVTTLSSWQHLDQHREAMRSFSMREAFQSDPRRFEDFSLSACGLFLDYSKNLISRETRDRLVFLVEARPERPARLAPGLPIDVSPLP